MPPSGLVKSPVCSLTGDGIGRVGDVPQRDAAARSGWTGGGPAGQVSFWWMSRSPLKYWLSIGMTWMPSPAYEPTLVGMNALVTSNGCAGSWMSITWTPACSQVGSRNAFR